MTNPKRAPLLLTCAALAGLVTACGAPAPPAIALAGGAPLAASAGDAVRLSIDNLPVDATVVWSGPSLVKALPGGSAPTASILPQKGDAPAAFFLENPAHFDASELAGVLFVLDPGTGPDASIDLTATVTSAGATQTITATLPLAAMSAGDVARGTTLYTANCASCHGERGAGATAPGLNGDLDNVAGDPGWSPALLAMTARSDMDNLGVSLDVSMPRWLTLRSSAGALLTGQDFADLYAYLKTEH